MEAATGGSENRKTGGAGSLTTIPKVRGEDASSSPRVYKQGLQRGFHGTLLCAPEAKVRVPSESGCLLTGLELIVDS